MRKFIKTVQATNFKGRTFQKNTAPVTVITGENYSGKTAIMDAIRVALLGYSPRHGKTAAATFGFAGAPTGAAELAIEVEFNTGDTISRGWKMKRGSIKADFNDPEFVPPVLLDARDFLKKSGPDKVKFVFGLLDPESTGFTTEAITARIKKDVKFDEPSEVTERTLVEVVSYIVAHDQLNEGPIQGLIEAVVVEFKDKKAKAEAVVESMAGTIQGTTQLRSVEGLQGASNASEELPAKRLALEAASKLANELGHAKVTATAKLNRRATLEKELLSRPDQSDKIAAIEAEIQAAGDLTAIHVSKVPAIMKRAGGQRELVASHRANVKSLGERIAKLDKQVADAASACECPTCHSTGEGWREAWASFLDGERKKLSAQIETLSAEIETFNAEASKIEGELAAANAEDAKVQERRDLVAGLNVRLSNAREAQGKRDNLIATLNGIGEVVVPDEGAITKAAEAEAKLRVEVDTLATMERQEIAARQDARRSEQARAQHEEKKSQAEVYRLTLKVLAAIQSEMMDAAFGGFMAQVNLFARGIIPGELVYREGEIGYFAGASFVGLDYFSGTEELLTLAGLSIALAQAAPIKIVMMDELGRLTEANRGKLIARVLELVKAGKIDQFFGVDVDATAYQFAMSDEAFGIVTTK